MSTVAYKRNRYTLYTIKCVYILSGKVYVDSRLSVAPSEDEAIKETFDAHLWAKHPSFMCGVVGRTVH